jgi:ATP synthase protein I
MTRETSSPEPEEGSGDPWAAFGYLVAGVAVYGLIGWVLARWLHAPYLIPIGILVGAALGLYLVFARYGRTPKAHSGVASTMSSPGMPDLPQDGQPEVPHDLESGVADDTEPDRFTRPDHRRDDRGDNE